MRAIAEVEHFNFAKRQYYEARQGELPFFDPETG